MATFQQLYNLSSELARSYLDYTIDISRFKLALVPVLSDLLYKYFEVEEETIQTKWEGGLSFVDLPEEVAMVTAVFIKGQEAFHRDTFAEMLRIPNSYHKKGNIIYFQDNVDEVTIKYTLRITEVEDFNFPDDDLLLQVIAYGALYWYASHNKIFANKGTKTNVEALRNVYESMQLRVISNETIIQLKAMYGKNIK